MNDEIGTIVGLKAEQPCFGKLKEMGLNVCQLVTWSPELWTKAVAEFIIEREITGGQQRKDIMETVYYLQQLMRN